MNLINSDRGRESDWNDSTIYQNKIRRNKNMKYLAGVILSVWAGMADALNAHAKSVTTIRSFTEGLANTYVGLNGLDGK